MSRTDLSRRSFLGLSAAGAASALISLPSEAKAGRPPRGREVKNIIWMVSDGMSMGVPTLADHYLQLAHGRRSVWRRLRTDPKAVHGLMDTRSLNSMVTDSAAASSSWGSGVHVLNGALNTLPGVPDLTTLYDLMGKAGLKRGLVTTTTITHATPSGFAVAVRSRSAEPVIARLYKDKGVDVLMGGGHEFFAPDLRADKVDVYEEYRKAGYSVCRTSSEMKSAKAGKLLGIYSKGQTPYSIDRLNTPDLLNTVPSLAEMAAEAIDLLKGGSNGFILQVEGGRVDHAAHANDLGAIIQDQLAFEDAVRVCLDFARADGETLVVVTSDHGNANPGITGSADLTGKNGLLRLNGMKASYEGMGDQLSKAASPDALRDLVEAKLGIGLTKDEGQMVFDGFAGKGAIRTFGNYRHPSAALAMALGTYTGVGWTSGSHTSDYTLLTALGPGSELFGGVVQNVDVFGKLLSLRGLEFKNPQLTLEEAMAAKESTSALTVDPAEDLHWI